MTILVCLIIGWLIWYLYQKDYGTDKEGKTALMRAATRDNRRKVSFLLKIGADINARDKKGKTVLFHSYGFHMGSIEMVRLLIRSGADVNIADNKGNTVLMYACSIGSLEFVKILLEAGTDVNCKNQQGKTALGVVRTEEGFNPGYEIPFHLEDVKKIQDLLRQYGAKE